MNDHDEQEMLDNIICPKCRARGECEDLRRTGNSVGEKYMNPHKERIAAYRAWKKAKP